MFTAGARASCTQATTMAMYTRCSHVYWSLHTEQAQLQDLRFGVTNKHTNS